MSEHARLSPSSAHRWMQCPASVRLSEQVTSVHGESSSVYAREGTQAHEVAEIEASLAFGLISKGQHASRLLAWRDTTPDNYHEDMLRHAGAYVELLRKLAADHPHAQVMLEQRASAGVDGVWGTMDAAIVSPDHIHVIDYKYGMGVPVDAFENPQLMFYAIGGVDLFDSISTPETVCMSIHQPRLGHISHYCVSATELRQWRDQRARPAAALAMSDDAYFAPSDSACRFCPAAGECRARTEFMTRRDFGNPDTLTPAEMGDLLAKIPDLEHWCKAVKERALRLAYNEQTPIPGWKVVRAAGRRAITDQAQAIDALTAFGFDEDEISKRSLKTLADLERVTGGSRALGDILGGLLVKPEGKESLVPEQDSRPAIDSNADAGKDFAQ